MVTSLLNPKTHYGGPDFFPADRAGRFSPLVAEPHQVIGFDSPELASVRRIGRFVQTEPMVGNRAREHYVYAGNNPVSFRDPLGLQRTEFPEAKGLRYGELVGQRKFILRAFKGPRGGPRLILGETGLNPVAEIDSFLAALEGEVQFRNKLLRQLEQHEGREERRYPDLKGIPTIGIGFNLTRDDAREKIEALGADYDDVWAGQATLSDDQINRLLQDDLDQTWFPAARRKVRTFNSLPNKARLVVVDMLFNIGETRFTFPKMRAALEGRDWRGAEREMVDSKWWRDPTVGRIRKQNLRRMMQSLAEEQEE